MKAITSAITAKTPFHLRATDKQWTKRLIGGIALSLSFSVLAGGEAQAASFTFSTIADNRGSFDVFSNPRFTGDTAINDSGIVAFRAFQFLSEDRGPSEPQGVFTGKGDSITTIQVRFDYETAYCSVDINNKGTVIFGRAIYRDGCSLFISSNGVVTPIYTTDSRFESTSLGAINDRGVVAFTKSYDDYPYVDEILTSNGRTITTIAVSNFEDNDSPFESLGDPDINNSGTVAFRANLVEGDSGIFTISDGDISAISDTSNRFDSFGNPTINDSGTLAFRAELDEGGSGIFTSNDSDITPIADTSGQFSFFGFPTPYGNFLTDPAINNRGEVAFLAGLDTGGYGIFTSSNLADKVIAIGDSLFSSTVTELFFSNKGLNNHGQLAFYARLADGTEGIFRANPDTSEPEPVPEPASALSLLAFGALGVGSLGKSRKKQSS